MDEINQNKTPEVNLDVLCQGFDGGSFYGLEYVLEEFFQNTTTKSTAPTQHSVDWFGLNT